MVAVVMERCDIFKVLEICDIFCRINYLLNCVPVDRRTWPLQSWIYVIFFRTKVLRYCTSLYVYIKVDYCVFYVQSTTLFNVSWCYLLTGCSSV